jgi:hypothetical protein
VAALAEEGRRALGDQPRPAPGHRRGRRLAGALGRQLPARRADLLAAVAPDRRADPAARRVAANASMTGIGLAVQGVWATGFIGIRLTCAWSPRSSSTMASASAGVSFTPSIIVTS